MNVPIGRRTIPNDANRLGLPCLETCAMNRHVQNPNQREIRIVRPPDLRRGTEMDLKRDLRTVCVGPDFEGYGAVIGIEFRDTWNVDTENTVVGLAILRDAVDRAGIHATYGYGQPGASAPRKEGLRLSRRYNSTVMVGYCRE